MDNPKNTWRATSKVLDKGLGSTKITCVDVEGKRITKTDIAQALNHHFTTLGTKLSSTIECKPGDDPVKQLRKQTNNMNFAPIDVPTVLKVIRNLKNGKPPGHDKISTMFFKDVANAICEPVAMINNSPMKSEPFPDYWKLAWVTLIFESGHKSDACNYKPISINLYNFLKMNSMLTPNQSPSKIFIPQQHP